MKRYLILFFFINTISNAGAQSSALSIADSLYAVGSYTKAIEQYQLVPEKNAKTLLQIARSYRGLGNKKVALEAYVASLTQNGEQPITATEYGRLLITRGHYVKADSIFSKLANTYPDNPEYFYQRGRALKQLEKKADSIWKKNTKMKSEEVFSKAVQLDSTHQKALYQLGLHYLGKRDYPAVEKICFKALELDPDAVEIVNILAQNYYLKEWNHEAITWFEKLIALGQSSPFIHSNLGTSYRRINNYTKAIDQYLILLRIDDEDYGIHHILADLYGKTRDIEKAEYHAKQALYFKDLPLDDIYITLGRAYQINKKYEKAVKQYQLALKIDPTHIKVQYDVIVCTDNYYEDKKEVLKQYERFIEKHKTSEDYRAKFYVEISERRVKQLKKELFLEEGEHKKGKK
ncbi:tetratricopeptide repeat protein [uncultured Dokdonia sp.]|uniref:tetratricopeptide repeat protein n=1 Tax=uncultured Dokdonia sp. TaxID=575653 RepID=UPI00261C68B8|nr:tetratricopeptide repeat protein [uncultured Dokdonia sp.]